MSGASLREALARTTRVLADAGFETARRDAEVLLCRAAGIELSRLYSRPNDPLRPDAAARLEDGLRRRLDHYPLQYLMGHQEFFGRDFVVTEAVLIPRPDTETVVELALDLLKPVTSPSILDVGAGSGCLGLTLVCERPDACLVMTDLSGDALEIAQSNADRLGTGSRVRAVHADLFTPIPEETSATGTLPSDPIRPPGRPGFDLVVSNPPYVAQGDPRVAESVRLWEPAVAVFSGPSGFEVIDRLLREAPGVLAPGGRMVLELGQGQADEVVTRAGTAGWSVLEVRKDLAGIPRAVAMELS